MEDKMSNVGFICSSDGAKSSYEIGCIKAIKELNSGISCAAGAFMGSINAMLIAMDDVEGMIRFWRNASKIGFFDVAANIGQMYVNEWEGSEYARFMIKYLGYVTSRNDDMQKIRRLLNQYVNEEKVRRSDVKCAFVGISPYTLSPQIFSPEDVPDGQLADYIMCSALFPVLALSGDEYSTCLDYEISPYKAIDRYSPSLIISTDETSEVKMPLNPSSLKIVRPSRMMKLTVNESAEDMIDNIRLGYVDTLREVSFSYGNTYYINRLTDREGSLKERISKNTDVHKSALVGYLLRIKDVTEEKVIQRLGSMLSAAGMKVNDVYVSLLENVAEYLEVEKNEKYTDKTLRREVMKKMYALCGEYSESLNDEGHIVEVISSAKDDHPGIYDSGMIVKYFLILFATDPASYDILKDFIGSLHLKVILAIIAMIYFAE